MYSLELVKIQIDCKVTGFTILVSMPFDRTMSSLFGIWD